MAGSLLKRLTSQLRAKGIKDAEAMAAALLKKRGQMKADGSLTAKGKYRQSLGADGRAKARAVKANGGRPSDYVYNPRTNRVHKR